jgi:hypothetical protein
MSKLIETRLDNIDLSLKTRTKYVLIKKGNLEHEYFCDKQINHKTNEIITIQNNNEYIDYKITFIQYIYSQTNYRFLYKLITAIKE